MFWYISILKYGVKRRYTPQYDLIKGLFSITAKYLYFIPFFIENNHMGSKVQTTYLKNMTSSKNKKKLIKKRIKSPNNTFCDFAIPINYSMYICALGMYSVIFCGLCLHILCTDLPFISVPEV